MLYKLEIKRLGNTAKCKSVCASISCLLQFLHFSAKLLGTVRKFWYLSSPIKGSHFLNNIQTPVVSKGPNYVFNIQLLENGMKYQQRWHATTEKQHS
jgi:hypothetical protein